MSDVLIIGMGSTIRGDDALGAIAADQLRDQLEPAALARVVTTQTLTPELVGDVITADLVIFIDAAHDGPEGDVYQRPIEIDPDSNMESMVHFLNPAGLLNWAHHLYGWSGKAVALSIRGESFDFGDCELTPTVAAALPRLLDAARHLVDQAHHPQTISAGDDGDA